MLKNILKFYLSGVNLSLVQTDQSFCIVSVCVSQQELDKAIMNWCQNDESANLTEIEDRSYFELVPTTKSYCRALQN